jgi:hypothetical protein
MLLVYEALGAKSGSSWSILGFSGSWFSRSSTSGPVAIHEKVIFADKMNLAGIKGATVSCCRIKTHAARTRQWY